MRIEESVELPAKSEALWPWIATADGLAKWIQDAKSFEARPAGELAERSLLIVHLPRGAPIEAAVERAERGRTLALRARGLPNDLEVLVTFEVSDRNGGSALTLRAESQLTGILVFAEGLIASKARVKVQAWVEALRRALGGA